MSISGRNPLRVTLLLAGGGLLFASATASADTPAKGTGPSPYDGITVQTGVTQDPTFAGWASGAIPVSTGTTQDPTFASWAAQLVASVTGIKL